MYVEKTLMGTKAFYILMFTTFRYAISCFHSSILKFWDTLPYCGNDFPFGIAFKIECNL